MAPPPPRWHDQLMNLVPVIESGPCSVCHLERSCRSRAAPADQQHGFQGDGYAPISTPTKRIAAHCGSSASSSSIGSRRLRQFFMLITWLVSVSRSIKAAVKWGFLRNQPHSLKPRLEVSSVVLVLCRRCISVKNSPTCAASTSTYPTSSITRQSYAA